MQTQRNLEMSGSALVLVKGNGSSISRWVLRRSREIVDVGKGAAGKKTKSEAHGAVVERTEGFSIGTGGRGVKE